MAALPLIAVERDKYFDLLRQHGNGHTRIVRLNVIGATQYRVYAPKWSGTLVVSKSQTYTDARTLTVYVDKTLIDTEDDGDGDGTQPPATIHSPH
jgi:hypothetical protein